MRGLLYKEYCIFTAQIKTWLALLLFFIVFSLFTRDIGPLLGGLCASVMIHTFMPFTVERMSRSDRYTGTFPVMRKEIAAARYVCLLNKKLKADKSIAIQNEFARGYKLVNGL